MTQQCQQPVLKTGKCSRKAWRGSHGSICQTKWYWAESTQFIITAWHDLNLPPSVLVTGSACILSTVLNLYFEYLYPTHTIYFWATSRSSFKSFFIKKLLRFDFSSRSTNKFLLGRGLGTRTGHTRICRWPHCCSCRWLWWLHRCITVDGSRLTCWLYWTTLCTFCLCVMLKKK
jgi:hypothetical protein